MWLGKLNLFGTQKAQLNPDLDLKLFMSLYFDTIGWYALGHHDAEEFLAAITERDPHANFSSDQVQLKWAIFEDNNFTAICS
jgi:hypothetical protein